MSIFLPFWGYTFNNRSFKKRLRCITENSLFKSCLPWNFFQVKNELFEKKRKHFLHLLFQILTFQYYIFPYNNLILRLSIISIQIGHVGIRSCNWILSGSHATRMNSSKHIFSLLSRWNSSRQKEKVAIWRCLARFSAPFVSRRGVTQRIFSKSTTCVTRNKPPGIFYNAFMFFTT